MRNTLLALVAVLLASFAGAGSQQTANFSILYDLDSTSAIACTVKGNNNSPWGGPIAGPAPIKTTGSSVEVTAVTAETNPFADLSAGDILIVDLGTGAANVLVRTIAVKTDSDNVIVNSALDIENGGSGRAFRWLKQTCGTGAADGWLDVGNADQFVLGFQLDQISATGGVDVQMQCKAGAVNSQPVQVFPSCASGSCNTYQNYTTAGVASRTALVATEPWAYCRILYKIGTNDDRLTVTEGSNDDIDFTEGTTGAAVATLTAGNYATGALLAAEAETQLNAAATDNTYTVTYSEATQKFTITRATGTDTISFEWNSGPNNATSADTLLGFSADVTGATTYTGSAVAIDNGSNAEQITGTLTKFLATR